MNKKLIFLSLVIFSYLVIPFGVSAKVDKNPNFVSNEVLKTTIEELKEHILEEINNLPNFSDQITALQSQTEELYSNISDLVNTVSNLQIQVTSNTSSINNLQASSFPPLPNAPDFTEVTFANWFVNTGGATSTVFDASGSKYFWFTYNCQNKASLLLEYSQNNTDWYGQVYKSPQECNNGGSITNFVMGKYYRVTFGSTTESENFVVAQGRFYD